MGERNAGPASQVYAGFVGNKEGREEGVIFVNIEGTGRTLLYGG